MTSLLAFLMLILVVSSQDIEGSGELGGPSHCDFVASMDGLVQTVDEFVDKVVATSGRPRPRPASWQNHSPSVQLSGTNHIQILHISEGFEKFMTQSLPWYQYF